MRAHERIIHRQAREILRLRRQNSRLRQLKQQDRDAVHGDRYGRILAGVADRADAMDQAGYIRYVYSVVKGSSVYGVWHQGLTFFRRFRLISAIIRIASWIVALIQSGAVILLSTVLFVFTLPILLLVSAVTAVVVLTQSVRLNRMLKAALDGKKVYIFFPSTDSGAESVAHATVCQLAADENNFIFAVSPYTVSPRLFGKKQKFYFTALKRCENVYYIRKHYYFMLRRRVLSAANAGICRIF